MGDTLDPQTQAMVDSLRPIYEAVVREARGFGGDIEIAAKKACVSLRRSTQCTWNSMVSHRIRLESAAQVDDDVTTWLRRAYEQA